MLTPKPQLNLQNAREYFREHLSAGDYYSAEQKITGEWFGQGAVRLGLTGTVKEVEFLRLCEGLNPETGERLTLRKNSTRRSENGRNVANRRVFYDFTISPPKSVSVVALLQDDRILELHNRAVRLAMIELEKIAETRVRKSGQNAERLTGNIVTACFRHDTSRELDPHLHTHCVVFNATFDPAENRWKALEVVGMYRAQRFVENCYFHEVAKGLRALGYEIQNEARAFQIKGVPTSVVARFSKRHEQINVETQKRLEGKGWRGNIKDLREQVARDVRKRKMKDSTADRLRPSWLGQLQPDERAALKALQAVKPRPAEKADVAEIVTWVDEHLFERRSVVNDHELMAAALGRGRGQEFDLAALRDAIEQRGYIREEGTHKITSQDVLRCELNIVMAARGGRRRYEALNEEFAPASALSPEQCAAVNQILASRDLITLFRGGAGTGKSFALKEVERGLVAASRPVVVVAPQHQQVRDLQRDGLAAQTLAQLLLTRQLPRNAVVLVDEAGQVGGRQLRELIRLVQFYNGRLILSGDTRQHGAVAASDALRAIEEHGGLKPAEIRQIRRQNPGLGRSAAEQRFIRSYRSAVKAAAAGSVAESFDRLDRLGCVRELPSEKRRDVLAAEYLAAIARKETALVVAQTWNEVRAVNEAVREQLRVTGNLGAGKTLTAYQAVDATEAQKRDATFYQPGQFAYFLQRYGRYAKGDVCEIAGANERGVVLVKDDRLCSLGYRYTNRLAVAAASEMEIAPGDRLQLKFNGKSLEGRSLANGELVTVRRVRKDGAVVVEDGGGVRKTLSPSQRLFNRGYAVTSYASQGKTVDTVMFADAANRMATNRNQWYVAISRGRKRVVVFTSDKAGLRENIEHAGERELALELRPAMPAPAPKEEVRRRAWVARQAWESIERVRRFQFMKNHQARVRQMQQIRIQP
jgi:conjugative relaxase-like TrwC/TraI family protein